MVRDIILVTGGAGYIGSHTAIELLENGYEVVIVDNLCNASYDAVARVEFLTGKKVTFYNLDIRDKDALLKVFQAHKIVGVIHFAALKAVGESTQIPLKYYDNNINGTISLVECMRESKVKSIVFSSSATVYGDVTRFGDKSMIPIPEHCPTDPTNPYGRTKHVIECLLHDMHTSEPLEWQVAILRYFNPIGAHPLGLLGEDPLGIPNNLLPYLAQVASGRREFLNVFGNDYDSHDGTPIRDYIHVVDLAKGHIAALKYLNQDREDGLFREWNLGTGKGSTVFDVYNAFCKAVGRELPYKVAGRRAGDVLNLTANPLRANTELKWKADWGMERACSDLWRWTVQNPFGFEVKNYKWRFFSDSHDHAHDYNNRLHTIERGPLQLSVANYGATIQDITFNGNSVVTKFESFQDYQKDSNPYFGATIGRYANRIRGASAKIEGVQFSFDKNSGNNTLHGGKNLFSRQFWLGPNVASDEEKTTLEFMLVDADGSCGFPGELTTVVKYVVTESAVTIEYESNVNKDGLPTIVNLTNHTYFNLSADENIDDTIVELATKKALQLVEGLPTGDIIEKNATGTLSGAWDDCFVVSEDDFTIDTRERNLIKIVEATHPRLHVRLAVWTTEPAFQFYTGDHTNTGKYARRSGFCVEPSRYVDAINLPQWTPQVLLKPHEQYGSKIQYAFERTD